MINLKYLSKFAKLTSQVRKYSFYTSGKGFSEYIHFKNNGEYILGKKVGDNVVTENGNYIVHGKGPILNIYDISSFPNGMELTLYAKCDGKSQISKFSFIKYVNELHLSKINEDGALETHVWKKNESILYR